MLRCQKFLKGSSDIYRQRVTVHPNCIYFTQIISLLGDSTTKVPQLLQEPLLSNMIYLSLPSCYSHFGTQGIRDILYFTSAFWSQDSRQNLDCGSHGCKVATYTGQYKHRITHTDIHAFEWDSSERRQFMPCTVRPLWSATWHQCI
jgi:hypothetical protein